MDPETDRVEEKDGAAAARVERADATRNVPRKGYMTRASRNDASRRPLVGAIRTRSSRIARRGNAASVRRRETSSRGSLWIPTRW